ncbi:MAG: hypothetical protein EOM20_03365 [Spartobacteria bacterium]|nr:hypothetical protein [Spartobacteria bacterium]
MGITVDSTEAQPFLAHAAQNGLAVYAPKDNGDGTTSIDIRGMEDDDILASFNTYQILRDSQSGGGGGGGPSQEDRLGGTIELASALNRIGWEDQLKYYPEMAKLAFQLQQDQLPQQKEQDFSLAQQYLPQWGNLFRGLQSQERAQDILDVESLMPQMTGIYDQARSQGEHARFDELRGSVYDQIISDLTQAGQLNAADVRNIEQGTRAGQAARGMESGQPAANQEAVARAFAGAGVAEERKKNAMAAAGNFMGNEMTLQQQRSFDPFVTALGRPSSATNSGTDLYTAQPQMPNTVGEVPQGTNAAVNISGLQGNYSNPMGQETINNLINQFYSQGA